VWPPRSCRATCRRYAGLQARQRAASRASPTITRRSLQGIIRAGSASSPCCRCRISRRAMEEFQEVKTQIRVVGPAPVDRPALRHHRSHWRNLMTVPSLPKLGTPPAPPPLRIQSSPVRPGVSPRRRRHMRCAPSMAASSIAFRPRSWCWDILASRYRSSLGASSTASTSVRTAVARRSA
jgi:hypothetical protein